jgi:hydrogenase maturation factor HypF (carbamoyltransferase family)
MMSIQVFYKGSVQGVGFRWSMRHIAKGFELSQAQREGFTGRITTRVLKKLFNRFICSRPWKSESS